MDKVVDMEGRAGDQDFDKWDDELRRLGRYDLIKRVGRHPTTPEHYARGMEPIKFIQSHQMSFAEGCVIKYLCRYKDKGSPMEDLNKARHYIDILLKDLEE